MVDPVQVITPHLVVNDGNAAIEFYERARMRVAFVSGGKARRIPKPPRVAMAGGLPVDGSIP
jgi:hypothetical protein